MHMCLSQLCQQVHHVHIQEKRTKYLADPALRHLVTDFYAGKRSAMDQVGDVPLSVTDSVICIPYDS